MFRILVELDPLLYLGGMIRTHRITTCMDEAKAIERKRGVLFAPRHAVDPRSKFVATRKVESQWSSAPATIAAVAVSQSRNAIEFGLLTPEFPGVHISGKIRATLHRRNVRMA